MAKYLFLSSVGLAALALSACTQQAAPVVYKGNEFYGRDRVASIDSPDNETFDEAAPRYKRGYTRPVTDAAVPSVGVSDLPPPTAKPEPVRKAQSNVLHASSQEHTLSVPKSSRQQEAMNADEEAPAIEDAKPAGHAVASSAATSTSSSQFIWPVDGGKVITHFGVAAKAGGKKSDGINISIAEGEPVFAVAGGTVVYSGSELQGYGNMIILRHADGWMTAYAHARNLVVKKGAKVKQGDLIAYVGTSGGVKSPQLHFALRKGKAPVDPEKYLPRNG